MAESNNIAYISGAELNIDVSAQKIEDMKQEYANLKDAYLEESDKFSKEYDFVKEHSSSSEEDLARKKEVITNRAKVHKELAKIATETELLSEQPDAFYKLKKLESATPTYNAGSQDEPKDTPIANAKIEKDINGELFLAIDKMHPTGMSFKIYDGKIEFDTKDMSKEQLMQMLDYLKALGLTSATTLEDLKINDVDDQTSEMFAQAVEEQQEASLDTDGFSTREYGDEEDDLDILNSLNDAESQAINDILSGEEKQTDNANDSNNNDTSVEEDKATSNEANDEQSEEEHEEESKENKPKPAKNKSNKTPEERTQDAIFSVREWGSIKKNRKLGLTFFETHEGGYTVFTVFDKENPNNMKWDGIVDKKTGELKSRHQFKVYLRTQPSGKTEISFSFPSGGKFGMDEAERVTDAYKDCGITRVNFGKLGDGPEAVMREACARALIVPVGMKLSKTRVDKMIKAAEGKHHTNNPELARYKFDLARQLAYNLSVKPGINAFAYENKNHVDCRAVRHLILEYKFAPFRDLWEDFGLRDVYDANIKENNLSNSEDGASQMIGSVRAVTKLMHIYSESVCASGLPAKEYGMLSVEAMLKNTRHLTDEQKGKLRSVEGYNGDTLVRDLNPLMMKELYSIIQKDEVENARYDINKEYDRVSKSGSPFSGSKERQTIKLFTDDANREMKALVEELKDMGLPPILVQSVSVGNHDFSKESKKEKEDRLAGKPAFNKPQGRNTGNGNEDDEHSGGGYIPTPRPRPRPAPSDGNGNSDYQEFLRWRAQQKGGNS